MIAPGCSELQLPAVKPAGKSRFTTFWGAIIVLFNLYRTSVSINNWYIKQ
jgi:hypothetical protein